MSATVPPESQFTNYVDYVDAIRRAGYSQRWNDPRVNGSHSQDAPASGASKPPEARPATPG